MITAIRGATTISADTKEEIIEQTRRLYNAVVECNGLNQSNVVSIMISSTSDIKAYYPAAALRTGGVTDTPLFSCLEPEIEGSLKLCVRLLVTADISTKAHHIYLNNAATLRPDLVKE